MQSTIVRRASEDNLFFLPFLTIGLLSCCITDFRTIELLDLRTIGPHVIIVIIMVIEVANENTSVI